MSLDVLAPGNLWTNGATLDSHISGLPPVCRLTAHGHQRLARDAHNARVGYAWLFPGSVSRDLAVRVAGRFVADMEIAGSRTPEARRWAYWAGRPGEAADAMAIAPLSLGVTSHGYPKRVMLPVLAAFAAAGKPVFPQAYDRIGEDDQAADDVQFLQRCIGMHEELGFTRVIPLLNLGRGPEVVRAQIELCNKRDYSWGLWRAGLWTREFTFVYNYLSDAHRAALGPRVRVKPSADAPVHLVREFTQADQERVVAQVKRDYEGPQEPELA